METAFSVRMVTGKSEVHVRYVVGEERGQASLLPERLEDYVPAGAAVRVIDAFVEELDLRALGFVRAAPARTGRPGYHPRDLLKLYVWGYLNEVRSSRRLEQRCRRDVEAMWLLRRLAPDFKTIADFRRDNGAGIVATCGAFVRFCREHGLFTARLVAVDGSKFRAVASPMRTLGRKELAAEAGRLDSRIAAWLSQLDAEDRTEPEEAEGAVAAALAALEARRAEVDRLAARLDARTRTRIVEGEEEARPMGHRGGLKPPSYNVQAAVDADTGLILHHAVTDAPNDRQQLHPVALATKQALGYETLTVVADRGYDSAAQAVACAADGIVACVPARRAANSQGGGGLFEAGAFLHDPATDTLVCPDGRRLEQSLTAGGRFLTRHLAGTRTEMALSVLAYNLRRALTLLEAPA